MQHSPYGGSNADRWVNCPSSVDFAKTFGARAYKNHDFEDAKNLGTYHHLKLSEYLYVNGLIETSPYYSENINSPEILNNAFDIEYLLEKGLIKAPPINSEDEVSNAPDDAEKFARSVGLNLAGVEQIIFHEILDKIFEILSANSEAKSEQKIKLSNEVQVNLNDDSFGTADLVFEGEDVVGIFDLKTGLLNINATNNQQLLYYAAALNKPGKKHVLGIIKPSGFVDHWVVGWDVIEKARQRFLNALTSKGFMAGSWCTYCPAKLECKTLQQSMAIEIQDNNLPIDNKKLGEILAKEKLVKKYFEFLKDLAYKRLVAGGAIEGCELGLSVGHRKWAEGLSIKDLAEKLGVKIEEIITLKSPAEVDKIKPVPESLTSRSEKLTLKVK